MATVNSHLKFNSEFWHFLVRGCSRSEYFTQSVRVLQKPYASLHTCLHSCESNYITAYLKQLFFFTNITFYRSINKFPYIYGTRMLITFFTTAPPPVPILSQINLVHAIIYDLLGLVLILSSNLWQGCCCFGGGVYQHCSHEGLLYSNPSMEFRHSSPEALHTKQRERPLLAKEGTKARKFS
jgi:hypothetical protein